MGPWRLKMELRFIENAGGDQNLGMESVKEQSDIVTSGFYRRSVALL